MRQNKLKPNCMNNEMQHSCPLWCYPATTAHAHNSLGIIKVITSIFLTVKIFCIKQQHTIFEVIIMNLSHLFFVFLIWKRTKFNGIYQFNRNPQNFCDFSKMVKQVLTKNKDYAFGGFFPTCAPVKSTITGCASPMACKSSGWLEITPKWCQTNPHLHWRKCHSKDYGT